MIYVMECDSDRDVRNKRCNNLVLHLLRLAGFATCKQMRALSGGKDAEMCP